METGSYRRNRRTVSGSICVRHEARDSSPSLQEPSPATDVLDATVVAERIRSKIENTAFMYDGESVKATMTFGICIISDEMTLADCINGADEALYNGKESGRNKVVVA